jgi:muconolactone delta-isomerase
VIGTLRLGCVSQKEAAGRRLKLCCCGAHEKHPQLLVTVRGQQVCCIQAAVAAHVPPVAAAAAEQQEAAASQGAQHSSTLKALWDTVLPYWQGVSLQLLQQVTWVREKLVDLPALMLRAADVAKAGNGPQFLQGLIAAQAAGGSEYGTGLWAALGMSYAAEKGADLESMLQAIACQGDRPTVPRLHYAPQDLPLQQQQQQQQPEEVEQPYAQRFAEVWQRSRDRRQASVPTIVTAAVRHAVQQGHRIAGCQGDRVPLAFDFDERRQLAAAGRLGDEAGFEEHVLQVGRYIEDLQNGQDPVPPFPKWSAAAADRATQVAPQAPRSVCNLSRGAGW